MLLYIVYTDRTSHPEKEMKIVLLVLLLLVVSSLFFALFTLVKDKGTTTRTLRALIMRVALSILLIIILFISYKAGLIHPNYSPFVYKTKSSIEQNKADNGPVSKPATAPAHN